jgi:predicted DNA-binding transcriptional regulator YafY
MMRADRLISILLLLQVHRQMTARELAQRLEVSERTIHRDMEALSTAGIPVVAERGTGGGWGLMNHYRTTLTGLNTAEIQALFMSRPSRLLEDLGLDKAADAASIKLLASLPSASRDVAEYARGRIHIDVTGWHRSEESVALVPVIQDAIWKERRLEMLYQRGGDCEPFFSTIDPLGLVAKGSVWYLVAGVDDDIRSYRISRIKKARLIDEPCARPADFDLAEYWEHSMEQFKTSLPRYQATLLVNREILYRLSYAGRFAKVEKVEEPDDRGWCRVSMRFQFEEEGAEYVLGFGSNIEVVEPASLRERVIAMAREVVAFYSGNPD